VPRPGINAFACSTAGLTALDYLSCASLAGSQPDIATAIAASGIPREQLWITSKLNVESVRAHKWQCNSGVRGDRRWTSTETHACTVAWIKRYALGWRS
jgi:hypothetical protein